ncbi:hypothetical protein [Nissabacter sp. SGAir0207]|uniref:head-tail joining protein n=1 Tax=Nissabacter sp. SGAir0207 TaxID=2126321 RepID=UPI0010CD64BA|nr:hypothetical protein [Nissabacter sp. SGAir0207]QCR38949.1 hypothetical protein C1N62_22805 [Nissabacter sp. SGAir0207]
MIDWDQHLLAPLQETFGEAVNYRPAGGVAYDITGIFDRAYTQDVEPLEPDDAPINTTHPVLGVQDSAFLTSPKQGDRLYIPRVDQLFVVKDVQPDSHGGSKLILNRVKTS